MNRILVQAMYVTKMGRTYRSETKVVNEGQELFDFENELKYQLALKDYPIEFVNDHGHRQFIQSTDLETIIAAQLGYETVASVREESLLPQTDLQGSIRISVDPSNEQGVAFIAEHKLDGDKFNAHLPMPDMPRVKVRVKSTDPDNETTQEIPLPFAGPSAVARTIAQNQTQDPTRTAAYGSVRVRLGAGTDPVAPTP